MSLGKSNEPPALDRSAMKAYAHPLRVQMLRYLNDHGSATATQLARHLGESTGQTSYHLRQLAKHGMVEDDPDRGTGRERWWRARPFRFDGTDLGNDPTMRPVTDMLLAEMVRARAETLDAWVTSDPPQEWLTSALHSQVTCRLTPDQLATLGAQIMALVDDFTERAEVELNDDAAGAAAERVRIYVDLFPLRQAGEGAGAGRGAGGDEGEGPGADEGQAADQDEGPSDRGGAHAADSGGAAEPAG